jgi:hypothetical protein
MRSEEEEVLRESPMVELKRLGNTLNKLIPKLERDLGGAEAIVRELRGELASRARPPTQWELNIKIQAELETAIARAEKAELDLQLERASRFTALMLLRARCAEAGDNAVRPGDREIGDEIRAVPLEVST